MIGGLVEIAEDGRHLHITRGFLAVSADKQELGRIPLADIDALLLTARQITLSRTVLDRLAENKAVVVTCGQNFHPISLTWPCAAHHEAAGTLQQQISITKPTAKNLWKDIVKAKIINQACVLGRIHPHHSKFDHLMSLAKGVKSGDPDNREAQAARLYWPALLGDDFRRERAGAAPNLFLNYGYAILRAATARAVCGAGLHPALGIHHKSARNNFALVDDLMEPFRPIIDAAVHTMTHNPELDSPPDTLTSERKRALAAILQLDVITEHGASPVSACLGNLAQSLAVICREKSGKLALPVLSSPDQLL